MTGATFMVGDVFARLADIPDDSVDLVLTSPPFLALRSYLPADHPDKHLEIGSEANPAAFIDTLLRLSAEWGRVLAPHGSIAVELGDTYSGSTSGGGDLIPGSGQFSYPKKEKREAGNETRRSGGSGWPDAKSLALIPELYRTALAYGINPLTGAESPAGRWRVRNVVRWHRPNPPVGALGDKYRPSTSDLVVACRSKQRWFDLDAVRTEPMHPTVTHTATGMHSNINDQRYPDRPLENNPAGAPPLDTWTIPTQPFRGAHYATWPTELCRIPILSMCPAEKCRVCGTPRRRITDTTYVEASGEIVDGRKGYGRGGELTGKGENRASAQVETLGWSNCDCTTPDYQPGTVLDPFAGSGTTLAAAIGHGRNAIGVDLDPRNAELARQRVGMFLTIDDGVPA